ncbi:hypothetical protein Tco_1500210 [Tanacetum coccineum]
MFLVWGPIYDIVCQQCNYERCGDKLQNECPTCNSGAGNSFAYDPNPNSFDDSQNFSDYPTHYEPILCDFCRNDARYGHYYTPQVPNPKPCYNQNYDEFPQILPSFQQQSLCCENYEGPHASFECQPMNQNFHNSNSSGIDQIQPPKFPVIHQPPQETSEKILQAKEDLMISIETFLKKFNRISFRETPKVLMQSWDKFFEVKHAQSEEVQELICELPPCVAITLDSPITDSLIMEDKHLDTIPETKSDEFIKSSVENLVQNPSESEDECECDVPDCDDSQTTFFNPLFDDSSSSDDESSHEEVIHIMSFKTYSNPLFDLDEEIISSEFNPIHNEDLDSTPKNDRFDTESVLDHDTLIASSPKIDPLHHEFAGELITIPPIPPRIVREHEEYISLMRLLCDNSSPRPPENFHANPNTIIESLPTFPTPVEDSDSLMEKIDIFSGPNDSIPPLIRVICFDSEVTIIHFPSDPESFHVNYPVPIDTLLPFSSENEDKVFNHGVLASEEKSPPSSSHRGFKAFQLISESPMMIHGENTPNLGLPGRLRVFHLEDLTRKGCQTDVGARYHVHRRVCNLRTKYQYTSEPEHPEDLVASEDEAPTTSTTTILFSFHRDSQDTTIETRPIEDTERMRMTALELVTRRVTYHVDVVLRGERLAYEQESMETRQALSRSEAHCRALEARVTVLETEACCHEWQRQAADDLAV